MRTATLPNSSIFTQDIPNCCLVGESIGALGTATPVPSCQVFDRLSRSNVFCHTEQPTNRPKRPMIRRSSSRSPLKAFPERSAITQRKRISDFENNTNISLVHRYVYFAVDKAANSTIKQCLFEIEYSPIGKVPLTLFDKRCSPLLSPYQIPDDLKQEVFGSSRYFRFAFVRNPYTRLLSCYLDRIQTKSSNARRDLNKELRRRGLPTDEVSFERFIHVVCDQPSAAQNSHWRRQFDDLCLDLIDIHYIGRFEHLWDEMAYISQRVFGRVLPQMQDRGINKAPKSTNAGQHLRDYYTRELAELVYESYSRDFESFGYERLSI